MITVAVSDDMSSRIAGESRSRLVRHIAEGVGDLRPRAVRPAEPIVEIVEAKSIPGGPLPLAVFLDGRRCWCPEEELVNAAAHSAGARIVAGTTARIDVAEDGALVPIIAQIVVEAVRANASAFISRTDETPKHVTSDDAATSGITRAVVEIDHRYLQAILRDGDEGFDGLSAMRSDLLHRLGFVPDLRVRPMLHRPEATMTVTIGGRAGPVRRLLPPGQRCIPWGELSAASPVPLPFGIPAPGSELTGMVVEPDLVPPGTVYWTPIEYLAGCVFDEVHTWARAFLGEAVAAQIVSTAGWDSPLVADLARRRIPLTRLAGTLRQLIFEGIPLGRPQDLLTAAVDAENADDLAGAMRAACPWRVHEALGERPHRLDVDRGLEPALQLPEDDDAANATIVSWVRESLHAESIVQRDAFLVVPDDRCRRVVAVTGTRFPHLLVVGEAELPQPIRGQILLLTEG